MNPLFCCQCGAARPLTRQPSTGYSLNDVFSMAKLKPIKRLPENEIDPQVIASVQVYRNGGTSERTHICDDCQRVVLIKIRDRLNDVLASFDSSVSEVADRGAINGPGSCPAEHGGEMQDCAAYPACACDN